MGNALSGKVAFVTGAAAKRGMGKAIAVRLAQEGADVMVTDKFATPKSAWAGDEDWKGLEDVVKEIEAIGRKAISAVASVDNTAEVEAAVKKTLDTFGKIDILVNCAGTRGPVGVSIADGDEKDWRELFDVNAIGTMIVSKAVAKDMRCLCGLQVGRHRHHAGAGHGTGSVQSQRKLHQSRFLRYKPSGCRCDSPQQGKGNYSGGIP
jgi:NAD(P)-dependent dehydrogenase (short-subunit alcohol dehydrogenase family)